MFMSPIVYLLEEQINTLFKNNLYNNTVEGIAYSMDGYSVFHAYLDYPKVLPSGITLQCKFIRLNSFEEFSNCHNLISSSNSQNTILYLFLTIYKNKLQHKSFFVNGTDINVCVVKFVPEQSELYSRSKGLLETDSLTKKTVGIVGLGSGGSPIAIELAKAGIGNFVLIDFDRLELSNVARHICGINDLGRLKTFAVRDAILQKNPYAIVTTLEIDVNQFREECSKALSKVDIIICASDNDQSRFFLNEISLKYKIPAIFGRAITRATGGDVLRVRPFEGPCYSCLYSQNIRQDGGDDEEVSQEKQAKKLLPDYTSDQDLKAVVQVGLSSDIAPISNFMVKLCLVELSKGLNTGISSLEEDLIADFYIWANRRENVYENWNKLEYNFNKPSILRWYGAKVIRDPNCMVCSTI
jgi:molybdopterin-synthase adenylyltransferase